MTKTITKKILKEKTLKEQGMQIKKKIILNLKQHQQQQQQQQQQQKRRK